METLQWIAAWVRRRFTTAGPFGRILLIFVMTSAVASLLWLIPFVRNFSEWFRQVGPEVQGFILWLLLAAIVGSVAYAIERAVRVEDLKDAKAQADVRRENAEQTAKQLQERWDHLLDVECRDVLWKRPCIIIAPVFLPKLNRKTRFLTVLNLKGGVGKTTLTANLAACLATGDRPLRILLIDIDFQGTLGAATVDPETIRLQHQNDSLVNLLLTALTPEPGLLKKLSVPMSKVNGVNVILAKDTLETVEFQLQARYLMDQQADPRFRFRSQLMQPGALTVGDSEYDLVIFDCPPRVTTSVINAVSCSDYILIPTKLDPGSIESIPRTIEWLRTLSPCSTAEVLGVVASHAAVRSGNMVKLDKDGFTTLRARVESTGLADVLFDSYIAHSSAVIAPKPGVVASTTDEGRKLFESVAAEVRRRMKL